ncbi:MAG TPA: Asp23/Gls24 family envelope stress response protein [Mycobacterium sp.]|jgi:uncharacterized alkaline shock family protein YloU|nr:Asp23/Gls24 family envelope stress response protein [Mycobacterium sp.]
MTTQTQAPPAQLEKRPPAELARGDKGVGRNELGTISVGESVVRKLAGQAALEIPDAGGAAPRVLGKSLASTGIPGVRDTSLTTLPKTSVLVDGAVALVQLELSVRWPASIPKVTEQVRRHVRQRLNDLTGLHIAEVTIKVTDLVTSLPKPPRVR